MKKRTVFLRIKIVPVYIGQGILFKNMNVPALLVGLHKLIPGILFLVYASEIQHLDDAIREHHDDGTHVSLSLIHI